MIDDDRIELVYPWDKTGTAFFFLEIAAAPGSDRNRGQKWTWPEFVMALGKLTVITFSLR